MVVVVAMADELFDDNGESKFTFASLTLMLTTQTKEESQLRSENHNDDNQPFQPRFEDFFVRVVQDKIKF
ncbi:hypothetical protein Peur_002998 [Populus x canadensis]